MKSAALAVIASLAATGAHAAPELQLGLGLADTLGSDFQGVPLAPSVSARAGWRGELWTLGGRGLLLAGPEGKFYVGGGGDLRDAGGFQAWGLMAEAGLHKGNPRVQFDARAGAGLGRIVRIQQGLTDESYALEGTIAPLLTASVELRFHTGRKIWLGLELGLLLFTGAQMHATGGQLAPSAQPGGPAVPAGQALVTLSFMGN